jgi:hypothetical protein
MDDDHGTEVEELTSRAPTQEDFVKLCARLNELGTRYIVIGGFAIITSGYPRSTMDVDLLIDTSLENEALVYQALEMLPDQAVKELLPGEVTQYSVVRVMDEICVDLMASACGIDYHEAIQDSIIRVVGGIPIPFASPRLLWRMKEKTHREKDAPDLLFLRQQYGEEIFGPGPKA